MTNPVYIYIYIYIWEKYVKKWINQYTDNRFNIDISSLFQEDFKQITSFSWVQDRRKWINNNKNKKREGL